MFGLGMGEIMIILVLALVLLGPARLPDAAKSIGKAMRDFRKATEDVKNQFETVINEEPKPVRPKLVDPVPGASGDVPAVVPPGGVPVVAGEAPPANQQNVPGLEAALAEPAPQPAFVRNAIAAGATANAPAAAPVKPAAAPAAEAAPKA